MQKKISVLFFVLLSVSLVSGLRLILPKKTKKHFRINTLHDTTKLLYSDLLIKSSPSKLGIDSNKLSEIDKIVYKGIEAKAFPGCQVLVAVEGKVIYNKAFGSPMYDSQKIVSLDDLYDIASVTKIAASTFALMKLETESKFSLENKLKYYLNDFVTPPFDEIQIKDMMAHQAGLPAWIPFYKKTVINGKPDLQLYSTEQKQGYDKKVADNLWILNSYSDSIYARIMDVKLGAKKYLYSDLGYYFVKKIVEKQTSTSFENFIENQLYAELGLKNTLFNPYLKFSKDRIMPTEVDDNFRHQLIQGYVHDPGAAMLGGVGGHAGIFSNSFELASIMQLFLNKGKINGRQFLDSNVVKKYTDVQFVGNRRGAGFDKPTANKTGQTCSLVSNESFGHSGFTGTFAWADPKYKINYIFLSNRVYPSSENWKIVNMNIRTDIQKVIYEAVLNRKK
jgi:beta-N-acetylhexosaminidase